MGVNGAAERQFRFRAPCHRLLEPGRRRL